MMKVPIPLLLLLLSFPVLYSQTRVEPMEGTVSYVTNQHVYVKFASTQGIKPGDTLLVRQGQEFVPALRVENISSISCVCTPVGPVKPALSDAVFYRPGRVEQPPVQPTVEPHRTDSQDAPGVEQDSLVRTQRVAQTKRQDLYGYVAAAAYTDMTNTGAGNSWKMKYTLSLNIRDIANSNLSAESYLVFVHRDQKWSEIQQDIFNGLKIYNLSVNYKFLKHYMLLAGRKVNPRISNLGAVDGVQFEMNFKPFTIGVVAGSRPDYTNYGFDFNLLQFGIFLAHDKPTRNGYLQSTVAFLQQLNAGKTDRRFLYLQHANSVIRNLTFFGSAEVDLYQQVLNPEDSTYRADNAFNLTNIYLSLTYRLRRKLDVSFSYSARKNVIYYETYKSFLDQIIDQETRQGYLLRINYRPVSRLSIGATGGYRFQKQDLKPSRNLNAYISYSQIPGIGITATASFTILETSYISGNVYGAGLARDFFKGKLYTGIGYKYVDYRLYNSELDLPQHVGEVNLTWRMVRRLALSLYYEGTFQDADQFNRIFLQLQVRL